MNQGQRVEVTFAITRGVRFEAGEVAEVKYHGQEIRSVVVRLDHDGRLCVVHPSSCRAVITEAQS